jgi:putative SOS response-associated peptidase YedK
MCGRYAFIPPKNFKDRYNLKNNLLNLPTSYNVAPGQFLPVVINNKGNKVMLMRWGLVPTWAGIMGRQLNLINARAESITTKPTFRKPFQRQRCLVPASGFFEWQKTETAKVPYYFRLKDKSLFSFAGIWSQFTNAEGSEIQTYSIITTAANDLVKPVHDRMPVVLPQDREALWLDSNPDNFLKHINLLKPYPSDEMESYPVSPKINRSADNQPDLIQPLNNLRF